MNQNVKELMDSVVKYDYCIGCGICASLKGSPLSMDLNEEGKFRPFYNENAQAGEMDINALEVCPFSNEIKDENEIGNQVFNQENKAKFNEYTGYYLKNYASYVKDGDYRKKGSSGGMGTWIATQLLKENLVDGIIHVKSTNESEGKNTLFEYQISYSSEELSKGAKSKYYPIEMSRVIKLVKENEGRYALIAVPCFIKGMRLLAQQDEVIKERIKFYIGLVCGHLKSDMFAKSMGWQMGIEPQNLKRIDFRKKLEGKAANNYGVEVEGNKNGKHIVTSSPTKDLYTTNWGHGLFKYNACEFCDDVVGETADVTVGDAWLPKYTNDSMGTNIVIIRNPIIHELIEKNKDKLYLDELSTQEVYQSQSSGFRHRREGLSYRLYLTDLDNKWRPVKRVKPSNDISEKRKKVYEKRIVLYQKSFEAYQAALKAGTFNKFVKQMDPIIKDYDKMAGPSVLRKVLRKVKRGVYLLVKN
ncbi:Coenzyme F420 hydrogenase/dehydrogenase, beta subunit C-terminal domain [Neobacillus sp. 179-C4.2 HS]|uniref:Coenzyme F420 hydrogenase/dehydrogenase, beta subunit C-terminal domain n=1 Tax=Neobacillus driksii TaxID=3035913 RepID=A0ABV4YYW3_9BACI|nr:Coenzyme F420 hydrogenase/dehydrogenase, beta subunit C-terminal domain [Neobacillus sp. 179.-C4.2 HS]MDP5194625.1 Coenzyme F420 hydrogenase/dehydrogenase, beta subunit C-terminal domain [Neobacillus sp. 179.-C4.2 HS]